MANLKDQRTQLVVDKFYKDNGDCCAGCDYWQWHNAVVGECTKSNLISGEDRASMLGISGVSADIPAGHAMTQREFVCGNFKDAHIWIS